MWSATSSSRSRSWLMTTIVEGQDLQVVGEPEHALEVEVVGRLVEQQDVRLREQHRGERHPHPPAAGEFGERPVLRRLVEAEAAEDAGRARRRGVGVDVDEARLDVGDPLGVAGALGLGDQRRALGVGGEHEVDQRLGPAGRLLLDAAEPRVLRGRDRAGLGRQFAADQPEERRLAGAVAADEADPRAARQRRGRAVDQQALAEPVGEAVDMEHGRLLARQASGFKVGKGLTPSADRAARLRGRGSRRGPRRSAARR